MISLTFTVDVPPSTNNLYMTGSHGKRVLTAAGRAYKHTVDEQALAAYDALSAADRPLVAFAEHYALTIRLWFKDRRRRDISNCIKVVEDGLAEALGFDDCKVERILVARMGVDDQDPRCEVTLEVLPSGAIAERIGHTL